MADDDDNLTVRAPGEAPSEPAEPVSRRVRGWVRDLVVTVLGVSVLWLGVGWLRAPSWPSTPPLVLENLAGDTVDLASFAGEPVLVNFWATWCGPCRLELPGLVSFAESHPDVPVLFVTMDDPGRDPAALRATLRTFAEDHDMPLGRVLLADRVVRAAWKISTFPTTVAITAEGKVRAAHVGIVTPPQLWWWSR